MIQPQKLFMETIRVMEDVLENHTIVLYSLDSWKRFGRMEMSSPEIRRKMPNSIRIEEYQNAIETLERVRSGETGNCLPDIRHILQG